MTSQINATGPLSDAIKSDHRAIFDHYAKYTEAGTRGDVDAQERWANQLTWEVARHSAGEEIVVYPLFEKYLGVRGKEIADHDRRDHLAVKEGLKTLEGMKIGTPEYNDLMNKVISELRGHVDSEEMEDFPLLEATINQDVSASTVKSFERTKMFVPTRAHPMAPDRPPYETLAGFLAAPLDKLKDAFSKFPSEEEKAR